MHPWPCTATKQCARKQLVELSVEFLFEYVHNNILPKVGVDVVGNSKEELRKERYRTEIKNTKTIPAQSKHADNLPLDEKPLILI